MMDLIARIDQWGQAAPERLMHISGSHTLTYGELRRASDRIAAYLARTLPDDHSPIAVQGHKEPAMLIAFLGAVKAGHPYVPIDSSLPAHRVARIVSAAGAPLTLTPAAVSRLIQENHHDSAVPAHRLGVDDPFYIIFTSGSTGEPKGVVVTLGCLTSFVGWMLAEHPLAEQGETFLNQAPFSFDLSVMDLYLCLATGGTLFSLSQDEIANPAELYRVLRRSGVTVWVSTPSFAQMCLVERTFSAEMLPRLRRFLFCGETLPPETAASLLDRFPAAEVWNTYGPTETTVATTSVRVDRVLLARYRPLPLGYPKPDSRILVLDEDGRPAAAGERGEIIIAGPNVSLGYIGRPDLTARAFFELDGARAYRTGDWGRFQDGLLFFEGRRDHQIKLHGYRIELEEVESSLRKLPGVRDGVIVPKLKDGKPEWLAAFVIPTETPNSEFEASRRLRSQLAALLPPYMLPRKFTFMTAFPMTPNGKTDRAKLAATLA
jgi:D-alanine--poly(phosphoribitol) ligase subunit 1